MNGFPSVNCLYTISSLVLTYSNEYGWWDSTNQSKGIQTITAEKNQRDWLCWISFKEQRQPASGGVCVS